MKIQLLKEKESISVNDLAKSLNVSLPTVRSDLDFLHNESKLERTHGGAVLIKSDPKVPQVQSYDIREKINIEKKKEIAYKAYSFIEDLDCIIIDSSSTCYELAKLLKNSEKEVTVLTNGFKTASILQDNLYLTTVVIGGIIRKNSNAIEGLLGEEILEKINIDKVFFSSYGISYDKGFSDFNLYEIELKKKMLQASQQRIALIDSTKFDKSSISSFANLSDVSKIITDNSIGIDIFNQYGKYSNIIK